MKNGKERDSLHELIQSKKLSQKWFRENSDYWWKNQRINKWTNQVETNQKLMERIEWSVIFLNDS